MNELKEIILENIWTMVLIILVGMMWFITIQTRRAYNDLYNAVVETDNRVQQIENALNLEYEYTGGK